MKHKIPLLFALFTYLPLLVLGVFAIAHANFSTPNIQRAFTWTFLNVDPNKRTAVIQDSLSLLSGSVLNASQKRELLKSLSETLLNPDFSLTSLSGSLLAPVLPQIARVRSLTANILDPQGNSVFFINQTNRNNFFAFSYQNGTLFFGSNPNLYNVLVDSLKQNIPSGIVQNTDGTYAYAPLPFNSYDTANQIVSFIATASGSVVYHIPYPASSTPFGDMLGYAGIPFTVADTGSQANIQQSLAYLNGIILQPNQTLNYNNIMQPKSNQFVSGHGILGGKIVDMDAGWICGTATVLYEASLYAGLSVLNRSPHSVYRVASYGTGRVGLDSAVYFGSQNLVIKNTTDSPIFIHTSFNPQTSLATVALFGKKLYDSVTLAWPFEDNTPKTATGLVGQKNATFHWTRTFTNHQQTVKSEIITAHYKSIQE